MVATAAVVATELAEQPAPVPAEETAEEEAAEAAVFENPQPETEGQVVAGLPEVAELPVEAQLPVEVEPAAAVTGSYVPEKTEAPAPAVPSEAQLAEEAQPAFTKPAPAVEPESVSVTPGRAPNDPRERRRLQREAERVAREAAHAEQTAPSLQSVQSPEPAAPVEQPAYEPNQGLLSVTESNEAEQALSEPELIAAPVIEESPSQEEAGHDPYEHVRKQQGESEQDAKQSSDAAPQPHEEDKPRF
jgi:ribonuclease E